MPLEVFVEGYISIRDRRNINLFDYELDVESLERITSIKDGYYTYSLMTTTTDFEHFENTSSNPNPTIREIIRLKQSIQEGIGKRYFLDRQFRPRAIITKDGKVYVDIKFITDSFDGDEWHLNALVDELRNRDLGEIKC
ncbi:MAG: hypothetical protein QGF74_00980 [Candidatus Nanoarchaeia archaeon]|jgi:hypothetical protein|nr:hypothetical protein [Candidatus Nanoarchaeia archaeon]|tara:strand:+ start:1088 stop:1504 length:417 start_codon:yes stop_codon:yes gene_type:complete